MAEALKIAPEKHRQEWRRPLILLAGVVIFLVVRAMPAWPMAVDPGGAEFVLSPSGQAAIGLFLMAVLWWIFEAVPVGITAIAIGVFQALFLIRPGREAFRDFMDPAVMFIFGSLVIGLAFTKSGLARRLAYRMLVLAGERTNLILLGSMVVTAALAHVMAHTAAAATMFPILLAINSLYDKGQDGPTRFGKALFIGMAYAAGAGSIVTLLGSARAPAAVSMYYEFTGREIGFFELTVYLLPVGWVMVLLIWLYLIFFLKPERQVIAGLGRTSLRLLVGLGPMSRSEKTVLAIVGATVLIMSLKDVIPALAGVDRAALMLIPTILFFVLGILSTKDLDSVSWNMILRFSGAMSLVFCLWQTGAAEWLAVKLLGLLDGAHWLVVVLGVALLVMVMANLIMNVASIAITLPVSLVLARYLGLSPEVVMYASLVTAGMPFVLLISAAPNAIAFESRQFTTSEFCRHGLVISVVVLVVLGLAVLVLWPLLGMPILATASPAGG